MQSILSPLRYSRRNENTMVGEVVTPYKRPLMENCTKISRSLESADYLRKIWGEMDYKEIFKVLLLNRFNYIVGYSTISEGGVSGTVVDAKLIFQKALASHASGIIIAHNHPSGNLTPSYDDIQLTKKIKEGGKILDITLLDHIIITSESYYSFSDNSDI